MILKFISNNSTTIPYNATHCSIIDITILIWTGGPGPVISPDFSLYIDNILVSVTPENVSSISAPFSSNGPIVIGKHTNWNSFFNGYLDDIAIYMRPLTTCEINQLYLGSLSSPSATPATQNVISNSNVQYIVQSMGTGSTFQWQQDNGTGFVNLSNAGAYSGVDTPTLTINNVQGSMNNYVYRCVISYNSCSYTSNNVNLQVGTATGIGSNSLNNSILTCPNPVQDILSIKTEKEVKMVVILDLEGKEVLRSEDENVWVGDLSFGMYFIQIQTDEGIVRRRFVKE